VENIGLHHGNTEDNHHVHLADIFLYIEIIQCETETCVVCRKAALGADLSCFDAGLCVCVCVCVREGICVNQTTAEACARMRGVSLEA